MISGPGGIFTCFILSAALAAFPASRPVRALGWIFPTGALVYVLYLVLFFGEPLRVILLPIVAFALPYMVFTTINDVFEKHL